MGGLMDWRFWDRETRRIRRLRQAIAGDEMQAWYQPIVYGPGQKVAGCEILARWHHPFWGVLGAGTFIPFAEQTGLIVPITRHLMRQAERELTSISTWLPEGFHVSVNLSAAHALSGHFVRDCLRLQRVLEICRGTVCAEVTEREAFEKVPGGVALLETLMDKGVRVYLDDFATGKTGLSTLAALPVDGLKLDRRFVQDIPGQEPLSMAEMIVTLAQRDGLDTVAEGVETRAQHEWLLSHGVKWQQGYFFSPPLSFTDFRTCLVAGLGQCG